MRRLALVVLALLLPLHTANAQITQAKVTGGTVSADPQNGITIFKGIPFAAPPVGDLRWKAPAPVKAWTGVKKADTFANACYQPPNSQGNTAPVNEDCLYLNVWTPATSASARLPVIVWVHGGGFTGGSTSISMYDGTGLAKKGVVMVSLAYRLGPFGFMAHPELSKESGHGSGAYGIEDLIAGLKWVHDNIAQFGGNPGNVTIFGQSGGGGKVTTLMAMPSARGLFHRAIAQSGSTLRGTTRENATAATEKLLAKFGIAKNQLDRLQQIPWQQLEDAYQERPGIQGLAGGPVVDGTFLPRDPWTPTAPDVSATVPLMMGSVETEDAWNDPPPPLEMPEDEMMTRVKRITRNDEANARAMVSLYRRVHPGISNTDVWLIMNADNTRRANAQTLGELKAAQGRAASYLYYFTWRSPVHKGQMKAYHTLDIPFAFYNIDVAGSMTGAGNDRYPLAHRMSAAWAAFARSGNPNHADLPNWPAFTTADRATMIFGKECRVVNDPNREERIALKAIRDAATVTTAG